MLILEAMMSLKPLDLMIDSFNPLRESDLDRLECDLRLPLPQSYRNFLLAHNGGRFVDTVVYRNPESGEDRTVDWFYSIGSEDDRFDIRKCGRGRWCGDRLPKGFISIAHCDRGGTLLCAAQGPHFGEVVDFDTAAALHATTADPLKGFSHVANDLCDFLNGLAFWNDPDEPESGEHPIFEAAKHGDLTTVRKYIDDGFDVNTRNDERSTLLMLATDRPAIVSYLLANGADVHAVDRDGREALFDSCACYDSAKILLEHGADPNCRSKRWKSAPVLEAYDLRILKLLIAYGADVSVRAKDGGTVFDLWKKASPENQRLGFRILMDAGYDVGPEIDRLIETLDRYPGPGYPGHEVHGAEMRHVANRIAEIANGVLNTCRTLSALGLNAARSIPHLEAVLARVADCDRPLIEDSIHKIRSSCNGAGNQAGAECE